MGYYTIIVVTVMCHLNNPKSRKHQEYGSVIGDTQTLTPKRHACLTKQSWPQSPSSLRMYMKSFTCMHCLGCELLDWHGGLCGANIGTRSGKTSCIFNSHVGRRRSSCVSVRVTGLVQEGRDLCIVSGGWDLLSLWGYDWPAVIRQRSATPSGESL